jgi:dienelactone hydrolase
MHVVRARRLVAAVFVLVAIAGALFVTGPYVHGLSFVIRAADMQGAARRAADLDARPTTERDISIPTRRGPMRARLYTPSGAHGRAALLTSGLHPAGIDEPRLVALARDLSASGFAIVTPDIPELAQFEITPSITDTIEDSGIWLSTASGLSSDGKAGLMGISFSGGLSAVAAGRPALVDRTAFVFAFGGHDDLPRVLRYLCTGVEPRPGGLRVRLNAGPGSAGAADAAAGNAFVRAPHDYGVAVMLLGSAGRLVPAAQVDSLRTGIRRFLWASHLDRVDKPQAEREFAALVDVAKRMPEPSRTLLRYVNERDVVHLGNRLLPYVGQYGGDPALSVSKSPKPKAPVFLLHGIEDNVIPPVESEYFAEDLQGHAPVRLLLSGLISHAEVDRPPRVGEVLQLAGFWGDLLSR